MIIRVAFNFKVDTLMDGSTVITSASADFTYATNVLSANQMISQTYTASFSKANSNVSSKKLNKYSRFPFLSLETQDT
jgi:hypothetical protein